ncbi:leiomodin-3-like [Haliotis rubra]|uniref:leiomodin-3-like n=1 Tax=Haliotis rubra TaxID=36100 RepID=UPI001EE5B8C6|nr:leiomodin-3-like [Haliotis rubra]
MKWYLLAVCVILLGQGEATPVEDVQPGAPQGLFRATSGVEYVKDGEEQNDDAGGNDEDGDEENGDDDENNEDEDEENDDGGEDDENKVESKEESFWEKYNVRRPKNWKKMGHKRRHRYKKEIMEKAEKHGRSENKGGKKISRKAKKMMDIGKELIKGSHKLKEAGQEIRSMAEDVARIVKRFRSD